MGEFLATSAFRDLAPDDVAAAISRYVSAHGIAPEAIDPGTPDDSQDALAYSAEGRWTVVLWPSAFNIHDIPLCEAVSRDLGSLVSAAHVYDGDYWAHSLFDSGERRDRFASLPAYFTDDEDAAEANRRAWAGDADILAAAFDVESSSLRPYLQDVDGLHEPAPKGIR